MVGQLKENSNLIRHFSFFQCDNRSNSLQQIYSIEYIESGNYVKIGDGSNLAINDSSFSGSIAIDPTYNSKPVTIISGYAFRSCYFTAITIPDTITSIGVKAFAYTKFTELIFPTQLTEIKENAFEQSYLRIANLSQTKLKTFSGLYVFQTSKIEEIIFPETFTILPRLSLWGTNLKKFKFPKNLNSYGIGSIGGLHQLEYYESENPNFIVYGGVVYDKEFTTLIAYPPNCTETIEHTVTKISGICGFSGYNLPNLKIDLPITSIENSAIRNCPNLEYLDLSSCIFKSLPAFSLSGNEKLKTLILPDTLVRLEGTVFKSSFIENMYITSELSFVDTNIFVNSIINNIYYCGTNTFSIANNSNIIENIFVKPSFQYDSFFGHSVTNNYTDCIPRRNPVPTPYPKNCHCVTDYFNPYFNSLRAYIYVFIFL